MTAEVPDPGAAEPQDTPDRPENILTAADVSVGFRVGGSIASRLRHEDHILRAVDGVSL